METAGKNVTAIDVPTEDEAIGLALDDLDAKIGAFTSAMQAGLDALREAAVRARQEPRPKAEAVPSAAASADDGAKPSPMPDAGAKKSKSAKNVPVARPVVKPADGKPTTEPKVVKFRPKAEEPALEIDEDEALLATLDPKVAKAIRIKRRLGNNKKSVRELLEEHQ